MYSCNSCWQRPDVLRARHRHQHVDLLHADLGIAAGDCLGDGHAFDVADARLHLVENSRLCERALGDRTAARQRFRARNGVWQLAPCA